jgi:predicted enzyme related to lactoylglutathione lyase
MMNRLILGILIFCVSLPVFSLEPVSPITDPASNQVRPGKVSWIDLVTEDIRTAGAFYQSVFGWNVAYSRDGTFADVSHDGVPIATISHYEEKAPDDGAVWLISISVRDVNAAANLVIATGGEVIAGPEDLDDRGRYALVRDPQGAMFMLLQARGGDPEDIEARMNDWLWAELWTDDPKAATEFYEAVVGYRSVAIKDTSGDEIQVMGRDGKPRATVVGIPWEGVEPNWLPYIQVEDIVSTASAVIRYGGEVLIAPMEDADGSRVAVAAGPTGGVFALQQRAEP